LKVFRETKGRRTEGRKEEDTERYGERSEKIDDDGKKGNKKSNGTDVINSRKKENTQKIVV
jgi:hypothetical protein